MDILEKKLIDYKDDSFDGDDGSRVEQHLLVLANYNPETNWESACELKVPFDVIKKAKLDDEKVLDSLRGKKINLMGLLYSSETGYLDKSGSPRTRSYLRFSVKDIAFVNQK